MEEQTNKQTDRCRVDASCLHKTTSTRIYCRETRKRQSRVLSVLEKGVRAP